MRVLIVILSVLAVALAAPSMSERSSVDFNRYWSMDEILDYMRQKDSERPDLTDIEVIGVTSQGRDITAIRITNEATLTATRPAIFITAALTARDWLSSMSALNMIHELISHNYEFENLTNNLVIYILPIANPDGYEYSFNFLRGWAKNRRLNAGTACFGANIDRNFAFNWGLGVNSVTDPCSENFRGPAADSEEETRAIQSVISSFGARLRGYLTIKSFGSAIAYPFSHSGTATSPNVAVQRTVATSMSDGIFQKTGQRYVTGNEFTVGNSASGTSGDCAAATANVPFVYSMYLPRGGTNGYDVETTRINDIVDEIFYGFEVLAEFLIQNP